REQVEKDHAPPYCVLDKVVQVARHPAARPWNGYHWMARAAASICSARGLTRMSSVKFSQRTVPERSTKNSAGREMSCSLGPPALCNKSWVRFSLVFASVR